MTKTTIPWADYTWNPITGCSPVSEGCEHCYAAAMSKRFGWHWGTPAFHPERLNEPAKVKQPSRIFVCSMSDLFHEGVSLEQRGAVEDQARLNERWLYANVVEAKVKFVSVEPMFGPVRLNVPMPNWVIAGPETGPGARPCEAEWIDGLADECEFYHIPFFDKRPNWLRREFPA